MSDDAEVAITAVDGSSDGDDAAVAIRPERVQLAEEHDELGTANEWTGTVKEAIYKGSIQQYHVDVGGTDLHVERQINETTREFTEGDSVRVGFPESAGEVIFE